MSARAGAGSGGAIEVAVESGSGCSLDRWNHVGRGRQERKTR